MILQSLAALAQRENLLDEPGFVSQPVHWLIEIDPDGRVLGMTHTGFIPEGKKKEVFKNVRIPKRRIRSAGVKADLLVDKADYVFGINPKFKPETSDEPKTQKNADRLSQCFQAMLEETQQIAEETGCPAVSAQARAMEWIYRHPHELAALWRGSLDSLDAQHADNIWVAVPKKWKSNHLFAFRCRDQYVFQDERVRRWITEHFQSDADSGDEREQCLVSGRWRPPIKNHDPFDLPGDTGRLPLISFNKTAFEHYSRKGNQNAPISSEAATAYFVALRRLLGLGDYAGLARRKLGLNAKTTVLYWTDAGSPDQDGLADLLLEEALELGAESEIQQVATRYRAPHRGLRPPALENPQTLYTLVMTREKSRVVIRSAELTTIQSAAESLETYFRELEIVSRFRQDDKPYRGIRFLLGGLMPSSSTVSEPPGDLAHRLYQCALDRYKPYPIELLTTLIRRFRAHDKEAVSRRRIALLKAVLNRNFKQELTMTLDENQASPAYHLGRLFAVLEKIQKEATNAKAGISDRFLGAAVATPGLVFSRLLKLSHHHLHKIGPGRGTRHARMIDAIMSRVPAPLPDILSPRDQGTFMVGYHHQRAELWRGKSETTDLNTEERSDA